MQGGGVAGWAVVAQGWVVARGWVVAGWAVAAQGWALAKVVVAIQEAGAERVASPNFHKP